MFNQTSANTPIFRVDGVGYPCTSLDISMSMNAVPTATVMIGFGANVTNPDKADESAGPGNLLRSILLRQESGAYKDLIQCVIVEPGLTSKDPDLVLFRGFIVTATLQRSPDSRVSAAQISCVSSAAKLMSNPLSGMPIVQGGFALLRWIQNPKNTGINTATDATRSPLSAVVSGLSTKYYVPPKAPLSLRVANAFTAVIGEFLRATRGDVVAAAEYNSYRNMFLSALTSRWALGNEIVSSDGMSTAGMAAAEFDAKMAEDIAGRLNESPASVLDVLFAVLSSADYMLCAAPRLYRDGTSRFEIMPKAGWIGGGGVPVVGIFSECLSSFVGHYNPHNCLNTPDVYVLQMDNSDYDMVNGAQSTTTQFGIYSTSAGVRNAFRLLLTGNCPFSQIQKAMETTAVHRTATRPAPGWIRSLLRLIAIDAVAGGGQAAKSGSGTDGKFDISKLGTPLVPNGRPPAASDAVGNDSNNQKKDAQTKEQKEKDKAAVRDTAARAASLAARIRNSRQFMLDAVARGMFMAEFGSSDNCSISLPLGCSFGRGGSSVRGIVGGATSRLEEHIGDLVAVFPDSNGMAGFGIVGVLDSIRYSVRLGANAAQTDYTITLTQVHTWQTNNGALKFPLYTRIS